MASAASPFPPNVRVHWTPDAPAEVRTILAQVQKFRFQACLKLIYACGLRPGEACRLAPTEIDSARGGVIIRNAKGGTDRQVPIPPATVSLLREFWKTHRNRQWLFPAQSCGHRKGSPAERPIPLGAVQKAFKLALQDSGIHKAAHVHTLRHSYATHLLEANINLRLIQAWLGQRQRAPSDGPVCGVGGSGAARCSVSCLGPLSLP